MGEEDKAQSDGDHTVVQESALGWLRQVVEAGWADAELLEKDPDLKSLRNDPEFEALVAELGTRSRETTEP